MLIAKTHYESTIETINKTGLLYGYKDFDDFCKKALEVCGQNPTYEQFCHLDLIQKSNKTSGDLATKSVFSNVLYHLYSLRQHHCRVYYISPNLAMNLARTDINIDTHFFRTPFPEIYIQIDSGLYFIKDPLKPTINQPVKGFYVNYREENLVRIMVVAFSEGIQNDAVFYFKIPLKPGKIKDQLKNYIEHLETTRKEELRLSRGLDNMDSFEELFMFVFNCLLYITSKDADIIRQLPELSVGNKKSKAKIQKTLKRQERCSGLPIFIVGPKTASAYSLEQVRKCGGVGKWKLDQRLYVSGHWRTQWYGSEKDGSRKAEVIFIAPYEKGPELTEVLNKNFVVGKT